MPCRIVFRIKALCQRLMLGTSQIAKGKTALKMGKNDHHYTTIKEKKRIKWIGEYKKTNFSIVLFPDEWCANLDGPNRLRKIKVEIVLIYGIVKTDLVKYYVQEKSFYPW